MSDPTRPTGWSAADEPTVAVPAADGGGGPPTAEQPVPSDGGEPPRRNGWIAAIIVLLVLIIGLLAWLLLSEDDDGDETADTTTSSLVDETTTSSTSSTTSTTAPATTTTAPATTTTAAAAPRVLSLETSEFTCPGDLTLSWTTENAVGVEIAIDNPGGIFTEGPPNGSASVPAPCDGDTQTYYVTAIAANGDRSTQELTLDS